MWILLQFYGVSIISCMQPFASMCLCTLEALTCPLKTKNDCEIAKHFFSMKLQELVAKLSQCFFKDWGKMLDADFDPSIYLSFHIFCCPQKCHISREKKKKKSHLYFLACFSFLKTVSVAFLPSACTVHWAITQVYFIPKWEARAGTLSLVEVWERSFLL